MKKFLIVLACIIGVLILGVGIFLAVYAINEFKPEDEMKVSVENPQNGKISAGQPASILTFNVGYGALSSDQDCYFDGGQTVIPESEDLVKKNLDGMASIISRENADINFLQEVDRDAKRSYYIDELPIFQKATGQSTMFATNFDVIYVPFNKGMGKVKAGIVTMTGYGVESATRYQLPISFSWPISMVNLKRCLLETRIPIEGSDKELVLVNLHLEAYDSGEGKIAQTKQLMDLLSKEYKKGNYVIAGGDFNQTFEPVANAYPLTDDTKKNNKWAPGIINNSDLAEGFSFAVADNVATCRLDDTALRPDTQLYIIDGFIVSNNITVNEVKNLDEKFAYTDHNPVKMNFTLQS